MSLRQCFGAATQPARPPSFLTGGLSFLTGGTPPVKPPKLPPVALIGGSPESPSIQGALKKILPLCSVVQCFSLFHAFDVESFRLSPVAQTFFGAKKFFGQKRFATGRGRPTERSLAGGLPLNMI
eukprot:GHVU01127875.1.p4 GENE.GHVU01127875.1~~GHVU01127875.1.p4  ORF type:complete len:125 (-),score=7.05 GHVU01127875.1:1542-1916(-)